jgi:hypothetical protein
MTKSSVLSNDLWPSLPLDAWSDTYATLHLWTQIVGKIRVAETPWINHSWHSTLYVTPKGLSTGLIFHGKRPFQISFDFVAHELRIESNGGAAGFPLQPQSVAAFYNRIREELKSLDIEPKISRKPNEIADVIPFDEDEGHASYDPEYANRFWRILAQSHRVFQVFRARFVGKCSPIHFFWGAPDLAVTRFSGRPAPQHPGGVPNLPDRITREAYSQEVSSCGFWPGGGPVAYPAYYSYAYPEPDGFAEAPTKPAGAFYSKDLREFLLPYDEVRTAESPDDTLLEFLQTTYEAAANLAKWDRTFLEGFKYL